MPSTIRPTESPVESPVSQVSPAHSRVAASPASRIAAISAEIPLEIHGSRKSLTDGHPIEAFHEDTVSVIVFPNGGIVRLAAGVSKGQMVAVTNLNTQRGMLCRVANVRTYPNLKSYVEIEFTQPATGFWGVKFPNEVSAPSNSPATQATEPPAPVQQEAAPPVAPSSRQREPEIPSSNEAADEPTLVHVSADDENASPEIEAPVGQTELKPEDFWGASFPAEMIDAVAAPRASSVQPVAPAPPASKPLSPSSGAPAANTAETEPIDLAIDDDETWSDLLSQLPTRQEKTAPPRPPEISEDDLHLESAAPPADAPVARAPIAEALPYEAPAFKPLSHDSPAVSPLPSLNSNPASPAALKELERLALGHLDTNQDEPSAHRPPKIAETLQKPKRVSPDLANFERPLEHRLASSAAPLHSFTTPSDGGISLPSQPSPASSGEKPSFGNFLKDPEPRTSAQRVFSEHSDVMTASLLAPTPPLHAQPASQSNSGFLLAAAAVVILALGGAWFFIENVSNSPAQPAVVGKPAGELAPLPPGNLRPNAEPYETPQGADGPSPAAGADSNPGTAETGVEVELTTAVTPPSKDGAPPAPSSKSQAKPANRRSSIPPLNLSAPTTDNDGPSSSNVEAPPDVPGGAAAPTSGDTLSKFGANTGVNIPRPVVSNPSAEAPTGGKVTQPRLIWSTPPVYPVAAKQNNIQGDVKIDATINESGHVAKMKAISGPFLLQQPAMDAVRQWKYEPSTLDGKTVAVQLIVTVQFRR